MSEELKNAYCRMSTEQLEELLRLDVLTDDGLDDDAVFFILEILEEREKAAGTFVDDSGQMWDRFQENYLPLAGSVSSYEEDGGVDPAAKTKEGQSDGSSPVAGLTVSEKRKRRISPALRAACIALICGIVLTGVVSVTARAAGFDIWGVFARWNRDTFSFGTTPLDREIPQTVYYDGEYRSMQEALEAYDITEQLAPTWLPDGYALDDLSVTSSTDQTVFRAKYVAGSGLLARVRIVQHHNSDINVSAFEKDESEVMVYTVSGVDHFIFSNLERTQITWFIGRHECSVNGCFSSAEAQQIVDSIYEG